jgi:hypothetical protein
MDRRHGEGNAINYYGSYQAVHRDDVLFPGRSSAGSSSSRRSDPNDYEVDDSDDDGSGYDMNGGGGIISFISRNPWSISISLVVGILLFIVALFVHIESRFTTIVVTSAESSFGSRPNVIFMLADDLGWNSLGYHDYDLGEITPVLTELAQSGIIIDSYYAQEVCSPSRGALFTGRHPLTLGMQYSIIQTAIPWGMNLTEVTLANVFQDEGYATHLVGKWHLGHFTPLMLPTARGFDTYTGYLNGENYYWSKRNPDHTLFTDFMYSNATCFEPYAGEDIHNYSTFLFRDAAIDIIRNHNPEEAPLFLFLSWQAVHDPFVDINIHSKGVPSEYLDSKTFKWIQENVIVSTL